MHLFCRHSAGQRAESDALGKSKDRYSTAQSGLERHRGEGPLRRDSPQQPLRGSPESLPGMSPGCHEDKAFPAEAGEGVSLYSQNPGESVLLHPKRG